MLESSINRLPEPDDVAKRQSNLLLQCIRLACEQSGGWIPFSDYMNIALYEPALGYYSGGLQKFGEKGDFITAPEVSALFGQCIANQLSEVIDSFRKKSKDDISIIEFGAGSGVLALDTLLQLESKASLPTRYIILELSAELKHRQNETIQNKAAHLLQYVQWHDQLPGDIINGIVIANEVLDAMPVENFRIKDNSESVNAESLLVGFEGNELAVRYDSAAFDTIEKLAAIQHRSEFMFSAGYCSEFNPYVNGWLTTINDKLKNFVIFIIDYGYNEAEYYHADRSEGTLTCYYQHRAHHDFLRWPGLQDITAFVNYTDIAYSAADLEMEVAGYTTQSAFLLANGLADLHESQVTDDIKQQVTLSQQIKTLTLPSEMGDRFKVMALTKNYDEPLAGFSMLDLRNRL